MPPKLWIRLSNTRWGSFHRAVRFTKYWTFAFNNAVYFHNNYNFRTNGSTSWETFRQIHTDIKSYIQLPPFGCKITSYNNQTTQKVSCENFSGTFLGFHFSTKIAVVLLPNGKLIRTSLSQNFGSVYPFKQLTWLFPNNDELDNDYISTDCAACSGNTFLDIEPLILKILSPVAHPQLVE